MLNNWKNWASLLLIHFQQPLWQIQNFCIYIALTKQNVTTFEMCDHISSSRSATFLSSAHLVAQKNKVNMLYLLTLMWSALLAGELCRVWKAPFAVAFTIQSVISILVLNELCIICSP